MEVFHEDFGPGMKGRDPIGLSDPDSVWIE